MVLESLMTPEDAEKRPSLMFFTGMLYSSVAIIISLAVFGDKQSSWTMVLLTVLVSTVLMYKTLLNEESKDLKKQTEVGLLKEHSKALFFLLFLFLGFTASFTLWGIFLPTDVASTLFHYQSEAIMDANDSFIGFATKGDYLVNIIGHNLYILLLSFLFSFFFASGAILILTWNASVIGAFVASLVIHSVSEIGGSLFTSLIFNFLRIMFHGIFEMGAFFIAAMAGGILSFALIKREPREKFNKIFKDAVTLFGISILTLVFAGVLEVYINPLIFN